MHPAGEIAVEGWPARGCDPEELRLVRAVLEGERRAFDVLVERHMRPVVSVVRRMLDDPDEREDVVQETFVRAYRKLRTFRGEASLRTWFIRIAINACKRRRLAFWRRRVSTTEDVSRLEPEPVDPRNMEESAAIRDAVVRAVGELPERLRLPLVLHVYDELTGAEVAAALGCSESTVWSRIYAAQRELKKKLSSLQD